MVASSPMHICVTRSQQVNHIADIHFSRGEETIRKANIFFQFVSECKKLMQVRDPYWIKSKFYC